MMKMEGEHHRHEEPVRGGHPADDVLFHDPPLTVANVPKCSGGKRLGGHADGLGSSWVHVRSRPTYGKFMGG